MNFFKKLIALLLVLLMVFAFVSCGNENESTTTVIPTQSEPNQTEPEELGSPLLWKATDSDGNIIYFFGTIHVGNKKSNTVLKQLQPILHQCDALAVEFDVVAYSNNIAQQTQDLQLFLYKDGTNIKDHIPQEIYDSVVSLLRGAGLYSSLYNRYKPGLWYSLISEAMIRNTSLSSDKAMDSLLINDAYNSNIEVLSVESASFQTELLANLPDDLYLLLFEQELNAIDSYGETIEALYESWFNGDEDSLYLLLSEDAESDEEYSESQIELIEDFNYKMTTERNVGMANKAKEYISSGKTVFFAVGTAHFLGNDGIISLLENEGFSFERIDLK